MPKIFVHIREKEKTVRDFDHHQMSNLINEKVNTFESCIDPLIFLSNMMHNEL